MPISSRIAGNLRRFAKAGDGNFAVMMAAICGGVALSAGFGLNTAQLSMTRSNLLNALDSAVTSTARDLTTGIIAERDARKSVEAFLSVNGGRGFASAERVVLDQLVVDRTANTVRGAASVDVDLIFPLFRGGPTRKVQVESAALYSDRQIEVSMMLDLTGSMAPDNKLDDLKIAARNAINTLAGGQDPNNPRVRIALVPYSNAVNVGALAQSSVFVERSTSDRRQAQGNTAPRPVSTGRPDNCATERKGDFAYSDAGPHVSMVNRDYLIDGFVASFRNPPRTCPASALVPLTGDAERLKAAVKDFRAEGGTAGHIGVQWAWYTLSHSWADVMPAASRPARADPKKVAKYAILMTDGEFNLSYFDAARVGEIYNDRGKHQTRDAATRLCAEMRKAGIEIFTVGFKLDNNNNAARDTMRRCASPDSGRMRYYFDTSTGAELDEAFQEIARNIEALALTR